ncbi:hypothetical protein Sango_2074800 [Sesamum angolense]|uniref:Transposase n=1 Tax=Sesamum angolense TaxID=2727404 RepID=A0AAE1WB68_9LAMI|nr:hypothetical protein Sango_2074800 [Sesamum angolense]
MRGEFALEVVKHQNEAAKSLSLLLTEVIVCKQLITCEGCAKDFYKRHNNTVELGDQKGDEMETLDELFEMIGEMRDVEQSENSFVSNTTNFERLLEYSLSHPADSGAWKDFDKQYPDFARDPRNIRLGLAIDGFNPFGNMSRAYIGIRSYLIKDVTEALFELGHHWKIVQLEHHRHLWDITEHEDMDVEDKNEHEHVVDVAFQPHESNGVVLVETKDDYLVYLAREDVEPEIIDAEVLNKINDDEDESVDDDDGTLIQYCDDDDDDDEDVHNLQNEIEDD